MSIPLGIFDYLTYVLPGAVYLLAILVGVDAGWLHADVWTWVLQPSLSVSIGALIGCYLLGFVTYPISALRLLPWDRKQDAIDNKGSDCFVARNQSLKDRAFVKGDPSVLSAKVEESSEEWAASITSLRATGLMCRSCGVGLVVLAAAVCWRAVDSEHQSLLYVCALGLCGVGILLRFEGGRRLLWTRTKTLECAVWIDKIDRPFEKPVEALATADSFRKQSLP